MWNQKHNVLHHHYTNVEGHDDDLCSEPFLRMAHWQKRRWYHRFQHYYIWPLYTMLPPKWQFHDDFQALIRGRIGVQRIPRPRGWSLAGLFLGKAAFYLWAVVVPFWMHTWWHVLLVYGFVCLVLGVTLGTVFQLAHCIEEADVTLKPAASERLPLSSHLLGTP